MRRFTPSRSFAPLERAASIPSQFALTFAGEFLMSLAFAEKQFDYKSFRDFLLRESKSAQVSEWEPRSLF